MRIPSSMDTLAIKKAETGTMFLVRRVDMAMSTLIAITSVMKKEKGFGGRGRWKIWISRNLRGSGHLWKE
ncbi:unnamed protein product [Dovyalis caffra]|uniref:Uncharacterized protein n=1 Tax=Dovyalis caffra TaxID=77055 RepID=A0AAV1SM76_9ROSI|nr:unnamed protein product [Dovyalis caffra]